MSYSDNGRQYLHDRDIVFFIKEHRSIILTKYYDQVSFFYRDGNGIERHVFPDHMFGWLNDIDEEEFHNTPMGHYGNNSEIHRRVISIDIPPELLGIIAELNQWYCLKSEDSTISIDLDLRQVDIDSFGRPRLYGRNITDRSGQLYKAVKAFKENYSTATVAVQELFESIKKRYVD